VNFGTELQNTMLFVDRIKSVLKSQHKLQFILIYTDQISNYFAKSAKSRHLVKITANSENHGFGDFLLSMISICYHHHVMRVTLHYIALVTVEVTKHLVLAIFMQCMHD